MVSEQLVGVLRTSRSQDEIREAAKTLAQSSDSDDHQELYRMARGQYRGHLRWYDIDHIVMAIEALAESGTPEDRNFIKNLLKSHYHFEGWSGADRWYFGPMQGEELVDIYYIHYQYAPRRLRRILEYKYTTDDSSKHIPLSKTLTKKARERRGALRHRVLTAAQKINIGMDGHDEWVDAEGRWHDMR
jgi:hypothetical protein